MYVSLLKLAPQAPILNKLSAKIFHGKVIDIMTADQILQLAFATKFEKETLTERLL